MADKDTTVKTKKSTASESGKGKNRVRFKKFVLILTVAVTIGLYGCSGPENYNADLNSAGVESRHQTMRAGIYTARTKKRMKQTKNRTHKAKKQIRQTKNRI